MKTIMIMMMMMMMTKSHFLKRSSFAGERLKIGSLYTYSIVFYKIQLWTSYYDGRDSTSAVGETYVSYSAVSRKERAEAV